MNYTNKILILTLLLSASIFQQASAQDILTCFSTPITVDDLTVTADDGTAIDLSACTFTEGDLTDYLNCIAENNNISANASFILELSKGDHLNGVSTIDLLLMLRDQLKIEEFNDACETVAADVNGDNKTDIKDLVLTRRLILGIIAELPTDSWRFFKSTELNVTGIGAETNLVFAKEDFPLNGVKVRGVKVGDVNNSVRP